MFNGWKEIANYLGKGVRTVQRYELQLGLPVRRPAGKSRGSVLATKSEIDGWISASPMHEAYTLTKPFVSPLVSELEKMKEGLAEMRTLREETARLRNQLQSIRLDIEKTHRSVLGEDILIGG
jgi:hypothetical protein